MIFDCFTFFNELDILELRLNELSDVVDRFVIVEATETFQGRPKPLYFEENRSRFKAFESKIIHVVVEFPKNDLTGDLSTKPLDHNWAREHYQRDQIKRGLIGASLADLILVSDVDEILSASKLAQAASSRSKHSLTIFKMPVFRGSVDRQEIGFEWDKGPRLIEYRDFPGAQQLRMTKLCASRKLGAGFIGQLHARAWNWVNCGVSSSFQIVSDAGWHFTSIGDWAALRAKLDAFSHTELLTSETFASDAAYQDFLSKSTKRVDLSALPRFIQRHPHQFGLQDVYQYLAVNS